MEYILLVYDNNFSLQTVFMMRNAVSVARLCGQRCSCGIFLSVLLSHITVNIAW